MKNFLLLVMMLVTTVANAANLLTKQYIGSVYYNIYDDGTAEATYGTLQSPENYKGDIQIRSSVTVNGKSYTVTAIGEDAFYACENMTSINIPNTVKIIGATAFYSCTGLTEVEIPNGVDSIAPRAFYKCNGLKTVDLSNATLKTFGEYAFAECNSLQNIYLPKTLKIVPNYAFYCKSGSSSCNITCNKIVIPNSVVSIGDYAFAGYRFLAEVDFGNSVQTIGDYAFYGSSGYGNYTNGVWVFENDRLKSLTLPNSLKSIGSHAFSCMQGLTSVEIPNSVTSIGEYAFYYCSSLTSVEIPNSVTSIGEYAFYECSALKSVELSNSIKTIPYGCFSGCSSLLSVSLPNSVTIIKNSAFSGCTSLGSISIPNSVSDIWETGAYNYYSYVFSGCSQCVVYLCNDHISKTHSAFKDVKKVVSCDNVPMPVEINYAFFYNGKEQVYNIPSTSSYQVTGNKRTEEGTQQVTVHLYDGFTWTNGTSDDLVFDFTIYPEKLTPEQTVINGAIGQKLKDLDLPKGCKWVDDPETVLEYTGENNFSVYYTPDGWKKDPLLIQITVLVAKIAVELPTADETVYIFDGKEHTYQFTETDFYKISNPDYLTQINAGTYYLNISLKNKAKYKWSDGTTTDLEYPFVIQRQIVNFPSVGESRIVYTGEEVTFEIEENPLYTISNNKATDLGYYEATVTLNDPSNYMWENGSTWDRTYGFYVSMPFVKIPASDPTEFIYTGEDLTYNIPSNSQYTVYNNVHKDVGYYEVRVSLNDPSNNEWEDGTTWDRYYEFVIRKPYVKKPEFNYQTFTYTGEPQTFVVEESQYYTVYGNVQTNVGWYEVRVSLNDPYNYSWEDGTTYDLWYEYRIEKRKVLIPQSSYVDFTYNGKEQTYPIASDDAFFTVIGYDDYTGWYGYDSTQTNAGDYRVILQLKDRENMMWVNSYDDWYGHTDNLVYSFSIKRAEVSSFPSGLAPEELDLETYYNNTLKDVELPKEYSWVAPYKSVGSVGVNYFEAYFAPGDFDNYVETIVAVPVKVKALPVSEPVADPTLFYYIAKPQVYTLAASDLYYVYDNVQTNVGTHDVLVSLRDKENYVWKNTGSSDDLVYPFTISKSDEAIFEMGYNPNQINPKVYYGQKLGDVTLPTRFSWKNPEIVANKIGDNKYTVIYTPSDPDNYNTIETEIVVNVLKRKVAFPEKDSRLFVYNGSAQTYKVGDNDLFEVSNNVQTNAGRYDVIVSLIDKDHYEWQDGTTDDIYQDFIIRTKRVEMPSVDSKSFVYDGKSHSLSIPSSKDYTVSGNKGVDAGRYEVSISLADKKNYVWENNTTADIVATFSISKIKVEIPAADNTIFSYTGEPQTYKIEESDLYTVSGNVQTAAGSYNVKVALNNTRNYEWVDGSTDNLVYNFYIKGLVNQSTLEIVDIPNVSKRSFVYDGDSHILSIDKSEKYTVTDDGGVVAGRYEATLSLTDKTKYVWANGSSDDVKIMYVITKAPVAIPGKDIDIHTYNGSAQTYKVAASTLYEVSNNVQKEAGRYDVVVSLVDTKNYEWEDGSTDNITMVYKIGKAKVDAPAANNSKFTYTGKSQTYTVKESPLYKISNNKGIEAGRYDATVSLTDSKNYMWSDGSIDDLAYSFTINKAQVDIPAADDNKFIYNGEIQTYKIADSELYTVDGNKKQMAGKYEVLVSLVDTKNYEWENGTIDALSYNFVIRAEEFEKTLIDIPTVSTKNFIYDGSEKSLKIASSKNYIVSGNLGVDAGRYTVTLSLADPTKTVWSDGSSEDIKISFTISKAQVEIPAANDETFVYNEYYQTYKLDETGEAPYSLSNNVKKDAGKYIVKVSLDDPKNYEWSDGTIDDLNYSFTINKDQVEIPTADQNKFVYTGKMQTYKIYEDSRYKVDGNKQQLPGKYDVLVTLNDTKNTEWSNGTADVLVYSFVIREKEAEVTPITIPSVATKDFIYDGTEKSLKIASSKYYTVTGNKGVDAGRYTVTLSLTDATKTIWSDGSTDDVKIVFTIAKAQVEIPAADRQKRVYTGYYQSYEIPYSEYYKVENDVKIDAGRYVVTASLNDTKNYEWSNGSVQDLNYIFAINKAQVKIPEADRSKFVYTGEEQTYKLATDTSYTIENNVQTMPGKYEVLVSLLDTKNYEWSNGTTEALSYSFVIRAEEAELTSVTIPTVSTKNFVYDGTTKSLKIASSKDYVVTGNKGIDAGRYTVTLSLVDPNKTIWSDGSSDDIRMTFTIAKAQVDMPESDPTKFVYTGKAQTYKIEENSHYSVENNVQTMPGKYEVLVSLNDTKNYEWKNGTIDVLSYNFVIRAEETELTPVAIPSVATKNFIYNGLTQSLKIASSKYYSITGNEGIDAGRYTVILSLVDPDKTVWSDGSVDDIKMSFTIEKRQVEIPVAYDSEYVYNGEYQYFVIDFDDHYYSISDYVKKDAGKYTVVLSLRDSKNYERVDGSIDDLTYNFVINKAKVEIPEGDDTKFIFTGKEQVYEIAEDSRYNVEGNIQTMPGKYEVLVSLADSKNYEWENGTTDVLSYNFVIRTQQTEVKSVEIPTVLTKNFIYDGDEHMLDIYDNDYYTVSGNKGVDAGRYYVTLSLNDPTKTVWSDGTVDDIKTSFTIAKAQVEIPEADNSTYTYNRRVQTYKVAENDAYTVAGNKRTNAGYYIVSVALKDTKNYMWTDGTTDIQKHNFVIRKAQVLMPAEDKTTYVYDGKQKTYKLVESSQYEITGNKQTLPGQYEVRVALTDRVNYEWTDGTTSDLFFNFVIRHKSAEKNSISIPTILDRTFVYDGDVKSLPIEKNVYYSITGNEGVNAGRYTVTLSLNDPDNTVWSDGSIEDVKLSFLINKAQVDIPAVDDTKFIYNGDFQVYNIAEDSRYTVEGDTQKMPGKHEVLVTLKDPRNYEWIDGTTDALSYNFVIRSQETVLTSVEIPSVEVKNFVYDGDVKSLKIASSNYYNVSENEAVEAGRYSVKISLIDPTKTIWSDGSVDDIKMVMTISKAQVEIPAADSSVFVYNDDYQSYWIEPDSRYVVSNNVKMNAGKYAVKVALKNPKNYEWSDGSVDDLSYSFAINKAQVRIPAADTSKFIYNGEPQAYIVKESSLYSVYDYVKTTVGKYEVKVALDDTKNYEWSNGTIDDLSYSFTINKAKVQIPAADSRKFFYTGDYLTYNVEKSDLYSVAGNYQINVGNHDVIISLTDTKNYEWSDGKISDVVYNFLIVKQEVDVTTVKIPVPEITKFTYNSNAHTVEIPETDYYTVVGNTKTFAGKYVATVSLRDKEKMVWEDGSVDDIAIPYVITKATVTTPAVDSTTFIYDGMEHVYGIPTNPLYKISGNVQSLVGRHIVTLSLVDLANYMWSDGTSKDLQYEFVIKMKETNILPVAIPVVRTSNFIYNGLAQGLDIKKSNYYTISGDSAIVAGSYTATVSLKDNENTSWEDGTTADIVIPFTIAKAVVKMPSSDSVSFVYNRDTIVCPIEANPYYVVSGNAQSAAGTYKAGVSLIDKSNTVWENGSSEDLKIVYTIEKIQVEKPVSDSTVFVYNGDTMSLDLPINEWYSITGNRGVKAGKYASTIALLDKANTVWSDGTTDDVVIPFSIVKAKVEIPAADTSLFVYTGNTLVYTIADNDHYTVKGNAQSMIGKYSVVVSLNDNENYSWSDGSTLDLIYPFVVNEREVVKTLVSYPVVDSTMLVYNGEMQTFYVIADSNCIVRGNVRKDAGKYFASVSLADRNTMAWADGTTDDIMVPFSITKAQVEIPVADSTVFEFNGEAQTYYIPADSLYIIDGNVQTNIGRYDVYVSLVDINNYEWSNGTTGDIAYRFAIVHPIERDTVNMEDVKLPNSTIESGDTIVIYDNPGDYIYDVEFDSLAKDNGFENIKAENGDSGIVIVVPEDAKPGNYETTITIKDIDGTVKDTTLNLSVSYPSALIFRLMSDVVAVNNTSNEFVSYQWYKNGKKIDGATKQFYCDLEGVRGVYKVQVVNVAGDTLFIAEHEFDALETPFNITLSKNPVNVGEQFDVIVEGITDSKVLDSSSLVVYDMKGTAVINNIGIEKQNTLTLGNVGEYIVVVRSTGGQIVSKHLLVK